MNKTIHLKGEAFGRTWARGKRSVAVRLGIVDESCISTGVDDLWRCSRVAPLSPGGRSCLYGRSRWGKMGSGGSGR